MAKWVNLEEGDINWPEIYAALHDIGYQGTATLELAAGDRAYLNDACQHLNRILDGTVPGGSKPKA